MFFAVSGFLLLGDKKIVGSLVERGSLLEAESINKKEEKLLQDADALPDQVASATSVGISKKIEALMEQALQEENLIEDENYLFTN